MVSSEGAFHWKRRMGVHQAHHQSLANRFVHWICIPLELWSAVQLLGLLRLGSLDLALILILIFAPAFLATEPLLGSLMTLFLLGCRRLEMPLGGLGAGGLFAAAFYLQLALGHGVFERGRDDTRKNLAEFSRTLNPIPLLLVFYYHLVEIALAWGYRPTLKREIDQFARAELEAQGGG